MTVEEKIQEVLSNASGVVALVPASRIKVQGDWQNLPKPYIIHGTVSEIPVEVHAGAPGLRMWNFYQVDIYADEMGQAAAIRDRVRTALNGYHDSDTDRIFQAPGGSSDYDIDRRVAHITIDFEVAGLF